MKRIFLLVIVLSGFYTKARSQMNFIYLPEIYGRNVDGLGVFQVQNLTGKELTGMIEISIRENNTRTNVGMIRISPVNIRPGVSSFQTNTFRKAAFFFQRNALGSIVSQTRTFPPGEYTFCYHFMSADKLSNDDYENCFDASIEPLVPITLSSPDHKDKICEKRPMLSWIPPMPFSASMRFRLMLTEKTSGQSVENMLTNTPLILLNDISSNMINYPGSAPDLKEGKTYCWRVVAYEKGVVISTSEIWEFTVECKEAPVALPTDSYRELKLFVNGNYYIAQQVFKFSLNNSYNVKKLNYSIIDIDNEMKEIKRLPEVAIKSGLNNIDLDLTDMGLNPGKHYILRVRPFNEQTIDIRFIYEE